MRHSTNRDGDEVTTLAFKNGWTASIIFDSHTSACAVWPSCRGAKGGWIDHIHLNATDDEVAEFLVSVRRRSVFTPHYHSEPAPQIPSPNDEGISGADIRREFENIRKLIMNHQEALDALNTKIDTLGVATGSAVSELRELVAGIRDLTARLASIPSVPADDTDQLIAMGDRVDGIINTLTSGVAEAVAQTAPAPAEPAPVVPVETPAEAPVQ
jgi:hypothetical protein